MPLMAEKKGQRPPTIKTTVRLNDEEGEAMRVNTLKNLVYLYRLADNGDQSAITILANMAYHSVDFLEKITRREPELLRPFARQCLVWPALISRKKARNEINQWLLRELQVNADKPAGKWNPNSPATATAICMEGWLKQNADELGLPELNAGTVKKWFEKGWEALLIATEFKPEDNEFLAEIGKSAKGKKSTSRGMAAQTPGMLRDDVRAKIKELVFKSFHNVVKSKFA